MQEKLNLPDYYENPSVLHLGCEDNRSYYLPMPPSGCSENSRILSLSGSWQFRSYENPYSIDDFTKKGYSYEDFDTIPVPSCVQMYGYDHHQYTNIRYPFPYDPPYVPVQNPTFVYHKTFSVSEEQLSMRTYLNFEGVDSCFFVYLNNQQIGYSQVSHSTSEFDLTGKLCAGENDLTVVVLKWCDGSYLEDQDKFRMSGIFRDVYLIFRPQEYLRDYFVHTALTNNYKTASISIDLIRYPNENANFPVTIRLYDPLNHLLTEHTTMSNCIAFELEDPTLWNAESPVLYMVQFSTAKEQIQQPIGFRQLEIRQKVLYLNGQNIKIKGVNRHDSNPETGFTISKEQALKDLKMMKEFNINAIRTSHYPNAPWFPALCDQYGFYLIAEADLESHGCIETYGNRVWGEDSFDQDFCDLTNRSIFAEAILDRNQRNVIRDKNHACILFWSLGNESGYCKNMEAAAKWIKAYDPDRFVHYEGGSAHTPNFFSDADPLALDIHSEMYTSVSDIKQKLPDLTKPFLLCEFNHSMGNGPGGMEEYMKLIYANDSFLGGLMWEWCDHGIFQGLAPNGMKMFAYGGDSKEFPHDSNFCMDGLVSPDRVPHPGLYECKNTLRPVRAVLVNASPLTVCLENKLDFTNTKDLLWIRYEFRSNGRLIGSQDRMEVAIPPHQKQTFALDFPSEWLDTPNENRTLLIRYFQKNDLALTVANHELGFDELWLTKETMIPAPSYVSERASSAAALQLSESAQEYIIDGEDFCYHFDKLTGCFSSLDYQHTARLTHPMEYNIFRAPTDNDRNILKDWQAAGYDRSFIRVYRTDAKKAASSVTICCDCALQAVFLQNCLTFTAVWTVHSNGAFDFTVNVTRNPVFPFLPRFGLRLFLPGKYQQITYVGYGPSESYSDKHNSSWFGEFESITDAEYVDYIRPQEHGSHYGCHQVCLSDSPNEKLQITSDHPFSFQAGNYSQEELATKKHNYELVKSDDTILCLDTKMSGIGSNSCGPALPESEQLKETEFSGSFYFTLI